MSLNKTNISSISQMLLQLTNSSKNNTTILPTSKIHPVGNLHLYYLESELLLVDEISKWIALVSIILSLLGNGLVLVCNLKQSHLSPYKNLIVNLAVADLTYTFIQIFQVHRRFKHHVWEFGEFACKATILSSSSLTCSMFTMSFMAVERFKSIVYPFHPRFKKKIIASVVAILWALAIGFHVPFAMRKETISRDGMEYCINMWSRDDLVKKGFYHVVVFVVTYPIPLVIIALSSINIVHTVLRGGQGKNNNQRLRKHSAIEVHRTCSLVRCRRLYWMFAWILLAFVVTTTPNHAQILWQNFGLNEKESIRNLRRTYLIFRILAPLVHIHSWMNPLIYSFSDKSFRDQLQKIVMVFKTKPASNNTKEQLECEAHNMATNGCKVRERRSVFSPVSPVSQLTGIEGSQGNKSTWV